MTDALTDQLPQVLAPVLTVPLIQLYAVLWRVGVVEIVKTRPASRRQRMAVLARAYSGQLQSA
ncbi:MAG: Rv1535 domain-containing protein [Mycobacterium sp.]|uniref:Rv1535 domain-containing protein n=1 Tax=Mycobacterium sp. TaxID=1785 RepID=UPI0026298011|nr:Rv1535 domain-containing protein [Mycobacterium sp.]MDI3312877.1 Rv1535 domain-containing protein [Mycobacterium sp.]